VTEVVSVPSGAITRWDTAFNMHRPHRWLSPRRCRFGEVAARRIEPVPVDAQAQVPRGSIHFDGGVTVRDSRPGTGKLFYAHPEDLVFSKIDARNGAIAVLPATEGKLAFSSEFPIYDLKSPGEVTPELMQILCRTEAFRHRIESLVVGHSGRRRLAPEILEDLEIPVPDTGEQQEIVSAYRQALERSRALLQRSSEVRNEASQHLLDGLGITYAAPKQGQRWFGATFRQLSSWSTRKVRHLAAGSDRIDSRFPMVRLADDGVGEIAYGLAKSPGNRPDSNPRPYLRVANVQAGELDLSEIKEIDVPDAMMPRFLLQPGDLLICEGNSEALVGRPAVWRGEIPNCVHQNHVLRVRLTSLDPDFVALYMNTAPARDYFLSRAKRTTNLASINSSDVGDFCCPAPPIEVQRRLAKETEKLLTEARTLAREATQLRHEALRKAERRLVEGP
jgi:type I restriction enzyme, S subunit